MLLLCESAFSRRWPVLTGDEHVINMIHELQKDRAKAPITMKPNGEKSLTRR
jgi:hypothetical protein